MNGNLTHKVWTSEDLKLLKKLCHDECSTKEIAETMGKTVDSVRNKIAHKGYRYPKVQSDAALASRAKKANDGFVERMRHVHPGKEKGDFVC